MARGQPYRTRGWNHMSKFPQTFTMPTSQGPLNAVKEKQDKPWEIESPFGGISMYGSITEAKREAKKLIKRDDVE